MNLQKYEEYCSQMIADACVKVNGISAGGYKLWLFITDESKRDILEAAVRNDPDMVRDALIDRLKMQQVMDEISDVKKFNG